MNASPSHVSQTIKRLAHQHGFQFCGISKAEFLSEEAPQLERWLNQHMHGEMAYMANHFDKRLDPRLLVDDCQTVISLAYNYFPDPTTQVLADSFQVSKYAFGQDYHIVIKDKMKLLWEDLQREIGDFSGRMFVDSAPVLEKAWAKKSGLGWIGKNANLIIPKQGSFFFLAELLVDLKAEPDGPIKDFCGTCTRCIDACPTDAITPYVVDGSKCISYFTIELKDQMPADLKANFQDWIFGCDICQDVCPWNRFSKTHNEPLFQANPELLSFSKKDWEEITTETFQKVFKDSPLKRTKWEGLKRNIDFLK